ncbi:MAG: hypothetical protein WC557_08990 [Ignavibacteriaceae bacterium]
MQITLKDFEKKVDENTGSILFFKKGFRGIPERVINRDGFTIEIQNDEIVLIDIYNSELMLSQLIPEINYAA